MLTAGELMQALAALPRDTEVRLGDVSEQDELHCSVGKIKHRAGYAILIHGSDEIWRDETLASEVLAEQLWPEEDESED